MKYTWPTDRERAPLFYYIYIYHQIRHQQITLINVVLLITEPAKGDPVSTAVEQQKKKKTKYKLITRTKIFIRADETRWQVNFSLKPPLRRLIIQWIRYGRSMVVEETCLSVCLFVRSNVSWLVSPPAKRLLHDFIRVRWATAATRRNNGEFNWKVARKIFSN